MIYIVEAHYLKSFLTKNEVVCESELMKYISIDILNNYQNVVSLEGEKINTTNIREHKISLKEITIVIIAPPYVFHTGIGKNFRKLILKWWKTK